MHPVSEFLNGFQKVICLSLRSSLERRAYIQNLVDRFQVADFEFFDATPGQDSLVQAFFDKGLVKKYPTCFRCGKYECGNENCNNTLIPSQVATFISYLRLWAHIVDAQFRFVLVIEDDIDLLDRTESVCREFLAGDWLERSGLHQADPMLLRFGWARCDDHEVTTPFSFIPDVKMSNPCHAINGAMAKHLLRRFSRIDTTVDVYQNRICATDSNSKTALPPLFSEKSWSTGEFDSLIHPKQIRLDYLEKQGLENSPSYVQAKKRLEQHRMHTVYRPVLAIGHPRCGSGYTAALLRAMGMDVGHEKMGADGISSWMFAVFDEQNPYAGDQLAESRYFKWFRHVVQHVRDPRNAIPSIVRDTLYAAKALDFRRKHIQLQFDVDICSYSAVLEQAVASLVFWNKIIEIQKPDFVYRVEDEEARLWSFSGEVSLTDRSFQEGELPGKDINKDKPYSGVIRKKPEISDFEIGKIDPGLLALLNGHCLKYGYDGFTQS